MRRSHYGPTRCALCKAESESTVHLFLKCDSVQQVWSNIKPYTNYNGVWNGPDAISAWIDWGNRHKGKKEANLPIVVNWIIWKVRNHVIFDDKPPVWPLIEASIISAYRELPEPPPPKTRRPNPPPIIDQSIPWAFFDGAANAQSCRGGFILHKSSNHSYHIKAGLGAGTNNFAVLISLRHLLHFAISHQCTSINIYGDSQIIINWFNEISICHLHTLRVIFDEVRHLKEAFNHISVAHIYREHNMTADKLSKEAALMDRGTWEITEFLDQQEQKFYHRPYIDPGYPTAGLPHS